MFEANEVRVVAETAPINARHDGLARSMAMIERAHPRLKSLVEVERAPASKAGG